MLTDTNDKFGLINFDSWLEWCDSELNFNVVKYFNDIEKDFSYNDFIVILFQFKNDYT